MRHKRPKIRDHRAESALFSRRALVSFIAVVLMVGVLLHNLYQLQVQNHQAYSTRSNDNRIKVIPVAPNRGLIYDRNGILLAENRPIYALEVTTSKIKDLEHTLNELAVLLDLNEKDFANFKKEQRRTRRFKAVTLKNQLTEHQVSLFSVNQHKFPGVEVRAYLKRYYPYGSALTHVLGYVSKINDRDLNRLEDKGVLNNYKATRDIGKLGIEKSYEHLLHGQSGYQEVEVNSRGKIIRTLKYVPPTPGQDIQLTLDLNLQLYIEQILTKQKKDPKTGEMITKASRGAVVVMDPKDSSVLAMVSSPSYDSNQFVHGISTKNYKALLSDKARPLMNRTTLGIYPPASTVKPMIAVAALSEGIITTKTTRNDPGWWKIPNSNSRPFRDWLRRGHGRVNISKAIEESVDTFFYQIAYDMGIDRLSVWMNKFGYGKQTGIDIDEENGANMPTRIWKQNRFRKPWYQGDTIPIGVGQGYWTATPIQMAKATTILVKNGVVKEPHLLKATIKDKKVTLNPIQEKDSITGVPQRYWQAAKEGMYLVAHGYKGTGRHAFSGTPYKAAAKSGTAQVFGLAEDEEYNSEEVAEHLRDHALFIAYAPFHKPKAVVSVVLENAGGGSSHAGPISRKILDYILVDHKEAFNDSPPIANLEGTG